MEVDRYSIFDKMLEGIQIVDKSGAYLYVNDALVLQSKRSREALLGSTMVEEYPGIQNTGLFTKIQDCLNVKKSDEWINEFDFPDGSKGFFLLRMQPIEDHVLIMSFDVTEQKKAEQVIILNNAYLEEIVKARTIELSEQKVVIEGQLEHLKELNTTKDKFFSIVAHDLMSPLNSLRGLSNLIHMGIEKFEKEEMSNITSRLRDSVDHTIKLAENLISWARLQMNSGVTARKVFLVNDIVADVCSLYQDLATKKGIKLKYDIEENLMVFGDKNQISFIVRNLVNNAIKYTFMNGEVAVNGRTFDNSLIKISVSDDGTGISEATKVSIQKLKANKSIKGTAGENGTGLGLLLCFEFVELNKGRIEIESEEGKGATIDVFLNVNEPAYNAVLASLKPAN